MKVYVVTHESEFSDSTRGVLAVFSTEEKAEAFKSKFHEDVYTEVLELDVETVRSSMLYEGEGVWPIKEGFTFPTW